MRRVESYDEVRAITREGMRARAETNCFLTEKDYRRELESGSLYLHEWEGGFAFMRRRSGYFVMNLYLLSPGMVKPPDVAAVCETVFCAKRRDGEILRGALTDSGFRPILRRVRLTSDRALQTPDTCGIETASTAGLTALLALMERCFDPITGCIPTLRQLSTDIAEGGVHIIRRNGELASAIHVSGGEIRHLVTAAEYRGQGLAASLVRYASSVRDGKLLRVWCARDRADVRSLYRSCGFAEDGFESEVLLYGAPDVNSDVNIREEKLPAGRPVE